MFSFRIELGVHMIYFHATLEQLVIYRSNYEALCRYVLRLNEELNAAKFGLTPDGFVSLMIDWHIEDVSIAELEQAIKLLVSYYRLYYPDIQLVAQDITLNAQMLKLIARGKLIETDMGMRLDESSA
ncbi:MAG: hypothetical protein IPK17_17530 [Chloroflexi bacterium]|uniref:hypothetical protein n=1 Tax=Candidatus Flexifilum breve TaxID=3140694 RepID=UPI003136C0F0|nr:hypothetical protein [Chloroflexota bacterium]